MYTIMYTLFCIRNFGNSKDLESQSLIESFQQLYQISCLAVQVFLIGLLLLLWSIQALFEFIAYTSNQGSMIALSLKQLF